MKKIIAFVVTSLFVTSVFAAETVDPAKAPVAEPKKQEVNCVKKNKKGECPAPPKGKKPTPKKSTPKKSSDTAAK